MIYKNEIVNLNTELYIEEEFDLLNIKTKKILEFSVCEKTKFQIIFVSYKKKVILKVNLNEKIKDVLKRFSKKARIDLTEINFSYGGEQFDYENVGDKLINELQINKFDKKDKLITILYAHKRNDTIHSIEIEEEPNENSRISGFREDINNFQENLIENAEGIIHNGENTNIKKGYYLKIFLILIIQYVLIISLSIIGFLYKFNEILIKYDISLEVKYIPFISIIFLISIAIECLFDYGTKKFMIIFLVLYPLFIIYFCLLLSEYFESKYIITGLSLITIQILSLPFNIILQKFKPIYLCLSAGISSFIGLILFSAFWVKSLYPIIYISLFWILSIGYYILWIFLINKKSDEYLYSSLNHNYMLLLLLLRLIVKLQKKIYEYIKERIDDNDDVIQEKKIFYLKNFIILFIQYVIILISTILLFFYGINEKLINWDVSLAIKYTPFLVFIFAITIIILILWNNKKKEFLITFLLFFPPFIIYHCLLLSEYIDSKYIIIGLILVGGELLSLLFNILLKKFEIKYFILFSSIVSFIGLLFISIFWLKSLFPILFVSIFWLVSNALYISLLITINKICKLDEYYFSSLVFNYSIILGLAFLTLYAALYIYNLIKSRINDIDDENNILKQFYFKIFITLFIEYAFILISTILLFFFGVNEKLIKSDASIYVKYIPFLGFMFLLTIIIYFCVFVYEKITVNYLIIFSIFYPPFIIYYSLLLSEHIDSEYIIIGLIIVGAEILSLLLNMFFKKFKIQYFILFPSILSCIALLFISIFWLKSWFPILYVSIFWLVSNIIYILLIFTINKICELVDDEYFYFILFFNYGIFLLLLYILIFPIRYLLNKEDNILSKVIGIFLVQNILIIIFVWIGFSFEWNRDIKLGYYLEWIIPVNSVFLLIASIHNMFLFKNTQKEHAGLSIYLVLYIPMMILYYYLFSRIINEEYILSFIFIIFIESFLSVIFMILAKSSNYWIIAAISIISGIVSSILFHFCWFKNTTAFIWIIVFSALIGVYLTVLLALINKYCDDTIFISVMVLNYGFFSFGILVAVSAIAILFFLIYAFIKCISNDC